MKAAGGGEGSAEGRGSGSAAGAADLSRLGRRARSSFSFAFAFLPEDQRHALDAVYAWCRLVDDAADEAPSPHLARLRLERYRQRLAAIYEGAAMPPPSPDDPDDPDEAAGGDVVIALRGSLLRFPIRREHLAAVVEGCEWDIDRTRYATWEDLRAYCYRVASAVGLACIEIFGYHEPAARDYAVDLGLALQLTNILRDVDEDAGRGRIYLPLEDLATFNVTEDELRSGRRTPAVLRLLHFEAQRARLHFARARAAVGERERAHLVVAEMMGDIYRALLDQLEREDFPAGQRASLSTVRKVAIALRRFVRSQITSASS